MDFNNNKPIYRQIVDYCFRQILTNEWQEEERILSVRELGSLLQVNLNTVIRSYEYMENEKIIFLKRGMGYYVEKNAVKRINKLQRKDFFETVLPETFKAMQLLGISIDEIIERYNQLK